MKVIWYNKCRCMGWEWSSRGRVQNGLVLLGERVWVGVTGDGLLVCVTGGE